MTAGAPISPTALVDRLLDLPVHVHHARVVIGRVALASVPEGRQSSVVELIGAGQCGRGEHVGWTVEVHGAFAGVARRFLGPRSGTVAAMREEVLPLSGDEREPHGRAALECALVDLALRQAGLPLAALAGVEEATARPMRYVISFDAGPAPAERARALLASVPGARFKIDVDPAWTAREIRDLADLGCVEILDWKGRGDRTLLEVVRAAFPDALFEDPPTKVPGPVARDHTLTDLAAVERACREGEAINVKVPRMGGCLAALAALERARAHRVPVYFGGMFEVGPGRSQARQLAALYTPGAPNDLAPLPLLELAPFPPSPLLVAMDGPWSDHAPT